MANSPQVLQTGRGIGGSAYLINGMSSGADPLFIDDQAYRSSMNTINRGGVVRTRPGYRSIFDLPDGNLQGLSYFKPLTAEAYLVFAINGLVYQSQYPFTQYAQLPNIQFYQFAPEIFFCQAIQSAVLNQDGSISASLPVRILVMQDGGFTRCGYWDGANSTHLDPSAPATFQTYIDETGAVVKVQILYGGQGYVTPPDLKVQAPTAIVDTKFRTAKLSCTIANGAVQTVKIDDPGLGYTFAPSVSPSGIKLGPPAGGPMAWSGNRLWVAQDNKLYASNIANPLGFSENLYGPNPGYFVFLEPITGMAEIPSFADPDLAVFTLNTSSVIQSSVQDRSTWNTTLDFQASLFPGVGCVGQRSITTKFGELWWMTVAGFTNFNAASQARLTSFIVPQDQAMAVSKFNLSSNLSGCAAAVFENFMLLSVPYSDVYNDHTWVFDQAVTSGVAQNLITGPYQGSTSAWCGYWTGTRPVQWAYGPFNNGSAQLIFHVSKDYDGKNRLWQAFNSDRTDNGSPITSFLETKTHTNFPATAGSPLDLKNLKYAEVNFTDVLGPVQVTIWWAGVRGVFKSFGTWTLAATEGSIQLNVLIGNVFTNRSQTRRIKTPEVSQDVTITPPCSAIGVETPGKADRPDWIDIGFSLLIQWEGQAAVRAYRIFTDQWNEGNTGVAPFVEYDPRVLVGDFCL